MSTSNFFVSAIMASTIFGSASAHMMLANPVPYGKSTLDTSPLSGAGADFPCKQRAGVYAVENAKNSYAAGAQIPISFSGSASHGGGSCQFALTTDKEPTASSKWQVIHSIEGGCPIKNANGNAGSDNYTVTIPSDFPPGEYAFGWTWFNRIGNREIYMNCAPMTITGGSSSKVKRSIEARKAFPFAPKDNIMKRDNSSSSYPDLYLANMCGGCETPEGPNVVFPNPGDSVETLGGTQTMATPTCSCAPVAGTGSASGSAGSGSGSGSGSGAVPSAAATTTQAAVSTSAAVASSQDGGAGVLSTAVATATVVSTAEPASETGTTGSSSGSSTGSAGMNSTTSSSTTGGNQTCDGSAAVICSADGTQFGLCNNGSALMQAVAVGTKCVGGNIVAA